MAEGLQAGPDGKVNMDYLDYCMERFAATDAGGMLESFWAAISEIANDEVARREHPGLLSPLVSVLTPRSPRAPGAEAKGENESSWKDVAELEVLILGLLLSSTSAKLDGLLLEGENESSSTSAELEGLLLPSISAELEVLLLSSTSAELEGLTGKAIN
jgi:hypothetical protein